MSFFPIISILDMLASTLGDPADKTLEDLVRPVSMGMSTNQQSLHYDNSQVWPQNDDDITATTWQGNFVNQAPAQSGSIRYEDLKCKTEGHGFMTVTRKLEFQPVQITDAALAGGSTVTLPLDMTYRLACNIARNVNWSKRSQHPFHRIATGVEESRLQVFGYIVKTDGSLAPIAASDIQSPSFVSLIESGGLSGYTTDAVVVLITVEVALCVPKAAFEPFEVAKVARCNPLTSVWTSRAVDFIEAKTLVTRPDVSMLHHAHGNKRIYVSYYSDTNPAPGVELTAASVKTPYWDRIFDNYRLDAQGTAAITAINDNFLERNEDTIRKVRNHDDTVFSPYCDLESGTHFTPLRKVPKQGEFDNVHMAPAMDLNGEAVSMAPLCEHDCFHLHWRWSRGFHQDFTMGWSADWPASGGPNTTPGTPLIPPNQVLRVEATPTTEDPGISYKPLAKKQDFPMSARKGRNWNVFFHHGFGYATAINTETALGKMVTASVAAGVTPALRYHSFRHGKNEDGTFEPLLVEEQFPLTEAL